MSSRVDEVEAFDDLLTNKEEELGLAKGHFPIHLLIELPEAYLDLADLARASSPDRLGHVWPRRLHDALPHRWRQSRRLGRSPHPPCGRRPWASLPSLRPSAP